MSDAPPDGAPDWAPDGPAGSLTGHDALGPGPGEVAGPGPGEVVVIAPSAVRASAWTVLGAFAIGASGWAAGRAGASGVAFAAALVLMLAVPLTGAFALQVFAPRAWTMRLGRGALRGHALGMPVDLDLAEVRSLRVERLLGDRALVATTSAGRHRWLLPVGADVGAVERFAATLAPATGDDPG